MITKYDELFCHQTVSTFDRPGTSAREWTERAWALLHETSGRANMAVGFGYYPNRNVMDAFACFTVGDDVQYTVRASRELRPEIDVFEVGPFRYEVIEPLEKVRFSCAENPHDLSYEVEVEGRFPLYEEPAQTQISRGRLKEDIKRMIQGGRPRGWVKAGGERFEIDGDHWVSERDRSWGVRVAGADFAETGVQVPEIYPGQLFNFVYMQFPDWGASFHIREIWDDELGLARPWHFGGGLFHPHGVEGPAIELERVEHHYEFDDARPEQPRRFVGGRVVMTALDGTKKTVSIRPIGICYQAPAGYGGQYKGFIHGIWMGERWMDGHRFDLKDPDTMREIWGYVDYSSEFSCEGQVGYGTTELMVVGRYPRYGYQGY
jgi:hypothetical protein